MSLTLPERLTQQFYEWERRGRGWYLFEAPVDLEPPFYPFFFHGIFQTKVKDDGRRPTIISSLIDFVKGKSSSYGVQEEEFKTIPIEPYLFENVEPLRIFAISFPKGFKVDLEATEQLLFMLSSCHAPVSFEIIASGTSISIQLVAREFDAIHVQNQLKAYFPECIIHERKDPVEEIMNQGHCAYITDFGLQHEFMRPLAMTEDFTLDPFIGLFGVLEGLDEKDHIVIQILFKGAGNPWSESIMRSVLDSRGDAFFVDAPEMVPLAKEKIAYPLYGVTIKVLTESTTIEQAHYLSESVGRALVRISTSSGNSLIPLGGDSYDFDTRAGDFLLRESHRLGMLLNGRELATFVHFPSLSVVSYKLERDARKTKVAPKITEGHELTLGSNHHQGKEKRVTVSSLQRLKHTHIIGATGTGKSTLLLNLIVQDIQQGRGIAVLDPHGDLIESIISYIPESRTEDVLLIDPADAEFPIGFNILSAHSEIEKDILSSDLVAGFRRLSTSWGDQMNSVFANAILAFLESKEGGTLADLRRFLVEKSYRDAFLKTVTDPNVIYYWQKEYPLLRTNSIGSILTRLDTFLRPKVIRNMVSQKKGLDFEALLDTKKIILVKLSQGLIGTENSYLLGTIIVSKIHQAAMARQAQAKEARSDFFLYIDEFQNFITPSMSSILSGARKYHVGLILAHQDMQQLVKQDSELANSVLSNAGTRICFRVGDADAKRFEDGFSFFEAQDLQNLNTGEAIVRIDRPEFDFSLSIEPLAPSLISEEVKNNIITKSREKYGTPKAVIEDLLKTTCAEVEVPEPELREEKKPIIKPTEIHPQIPSVTREVTPITEEKETKTIERLKEKKEETQHRYLQSLIKRMAESRGFIATIEEPIPESKGRVDVSLLRNNQRIAVEISVTTEVEWELHNLEKCLAAGYDVVVACSSEKKTLEAIQEKVKERFDEASLSKIHILDPERLFQYLDTVIAKDASTETKMKGYRVKVEYNPVTEKEMVKKRDVAARLVIDSMKKMKK